jgi:hypothetical protein
MILLVSPRFGSGDMQMQMIRGACGDLHLAFHSTSGPILAFIRDASPGDGIFRAGERCTQAGIQGCSVLVR